jgi:hypothetical protein
VKENYQGRKKEESEGMNTIKEGTKEGNMSRKERRKPVKEGTQEGIVPKGGRNTGRKE